MSDLQEVPLAHPAHFMHQCWEECWSWSSCRNKECLCVCLRRIKDNYLDSLMGLASLVAMDTERAEEGWVLMQRALDESPLNPDIHNNAGAFFLKTGAYGQQGSNFEPWARVWGKVMYLFLVFQVILKMLCQHMRRHCA